MKIVEASTSTLARVSGDVEAAVGAVLGERLVRRDEEAISAGRQRLKRNDKILLYTVVSRTLGLDKEGLFDQELADGGEEFPNTRYEELRAQYASDDSIVDPDAMALLDMQETRVDRLVREGYREEYDRPLMDFQPEVMEELALMAGSVLRLAHVRMGMASEV